MSQLGSILDSAASRLRSQNVDWALVGGLAVSVRTEPRFTRDIDIAVATGSDQGAEAVIHALQADGYEIAATVEQDRVGRLATARMLPPGAPADGIVLDLLCASSGIESEIVEAAEELRVLEGVSAPVARVGHLLVLKLLSASDSRPQDTVDMRALVEVADDEEFTIAREGATLIAERGYGRERDLVSELERLRPR